MPRTRLDLTGQQFGNLTVLSPAEDRDGRTRWLCACACGERQVMVRTADLRAGKQVSCGCGRDKRPSPRAGDALMGRLAQHFSRTKLANNSGCDGM